MWVLVASERALLRPWSWVLWIRGRNRVIVLASLMNSGMRQRWAQEIQPASSLCRVFLWFGRSLGVVL